MFRGVALPISASSSSSGRGRVAVRGMCLAPNPDRLAAPVSLSGLAVWLRSAGARAGAAAASGAGSVRAAQQLNSFRSLPSITAPHMGAILLCLCG